VQDIFGENAYRANQQLPGSVRADAPRLDMLAEAAVEAGFLQDRSRAIGTSLLLTCAAQHTKKILVQLKPNGVVTIDTDATDPVNFPR
jgi:hypothetical protein